MSRTILDLPFLRTSVPCVLPESPVCRENFRNIRGRFISPTVATDELPQAERRQTTADLLGSGFREALRARLFRPSQLLLMRPEGTLQKSASLDAYLADCRQVESLVSDLRTFLTAAVRAGMVVQRPGADVTALAQARERKWTMVQRALPPLVRNRAPHFVLDAETAGDPSAAELHLLLQEDFLGRARGVAADFFQTIARLYECGFLGLVRWTDRAQALCYYYYVLHGVEEQVGRKRRTTRIAETARGRVEQTVEHRLVHGTHYLEYHRHDLYRARIQGVSSYRKELPVRHADFLDAVPTWMLPHLEIVDGDIFRERIIRWDEQETEHPESDMVSETPLYSPAITIGSWVFAGWNGRDLVSGQTRTAVAQRSRG